MKNIVASLSIFLFAAGFNFPPAIAASFDCAKAGTQVEKLICTIPILGELDDALSVNFKIKASNIGDGASRNLIQTQREWIQQRNACSNAECIERIYRKRLDEVCGRPVLTGMHASCKYNADVILENELKIRITSVQEEVDVLISLDSILNENSTAPQQSSSQTSTANLTLKEQLNRLLKQREELQKKIDSALAPMPPLIINYETGDVYEGSVDKRKSRSGKGEYIFANGNRYVGEFRDGKPHGSGEEISITGSVRKGVWVDGVLVSAVTKIKNDSNISKEMLIEKARQGDAESQYRYGMSFILGEGDSIKPRIAFEWLLKAAAQGHDPAKKQLASMYDLGIQMSNIPSSITTKY